MNVDTVRVDEETKRRLTTLKRRTGISQWNILGRWAFCASISSGYIVSRTEIGTLSSIEMTWKVFAGKNAKAYEALALLTHFTAENGGYRGSLHDTISAHIGHGASLLVSGGLSVKDCTQLLSMTASS